MKRNRRSPFFFTLFFLFLTAQAPSPPPTWIADLTLTLHSPYHETLRAKGAFYQSGSRIRYEPAGAEEIDLYDLTQMEELRLFPNDRIYFRAQLGPARILKAVREGWMPPPAPMTERRILMTKGVFKEREARLYFIILEDKGRKWYSLRWVTADAAEFPLRTIYPASDFETVIADYDSLRTEPIDPARFVPPADFLSVNPF